MHPKNSHSTISHNRLLNAQQHDNCVNNTTLTHNFRWCGLENSNSTFLQHHRISTHTHTRALLLLYDDMKCLCCACGNNTAQWTVFRVTQNAKDNMILMHGMHAALSEAEITIYICLSSRWKVCNVPLAKFIFALLEKMENYTSIWRIKFRCINSDRWQ